MVIALATRSHWFALSACPLWRASKDESLIFSLSFSPAATLEITSTSNPLKPDGALLSKSSNGGYGTSEQTVNVPELITFGPEPLEPVLSPLSELPHPARASPRAEV